VIDSLLRFAGVYKAYSKYLDEQVKRGGQMPEHVGIILDGNRRWASEKSLVSTDGHWAGAKVGEQVLDWCLEYSIKTLTLYTFSTENFARPTEEVRTILKIVEEEIKKLEKDARLHSQKVRVKAIGRTDLLPDSLQDVFKRLEDQTGKYDGHFLNLAIAYTGRAEIVDATRKIVEDVSQGNLSPQHIDEDTFHKYLYTAHLPNPNPDLVIRTSGEERLSGFLLWQSAYSELVFVDVYWPEFRKIDFLRAIRLYQMRHRRFGR
jgi:tritrans,polycis-undecaprenyl-diphosphate synthase [geranylgeranyl-diphosphate specific]